MLKTAVSILVTSPVMSLAELTSKLGLAASPGSHDKGELHAGARAGKRPWPITVLRLDSDASESAPLQEHLERLATKFPPAELKGNLQPGCTLLIDVALFFETANVSAMITRRGVEIIDAYNAELEITCYPVE